MSGADLGADLLIHLDLVPTNPATGLDTGSVSARDQRN